MLFRSLTSSVAADRRDTTVPRVLTERSRNNSAAKAVKTRDSAPGHVTMYLASKTLAEKVAWKFVAANGSQMTWDLVVLNSPCVFGVCLFLSGLSLKSEVFIFTAFAQPCVNSR